LQAHESSFPKTSILATLVFLLISLNQCTADTVWGVPGSDFRKRLVEGEREFLTGLRIDSRNLGQAFRLGPGGPFYLAEILLSLAEENPRPGAPPHQPGADGRAPHHSGPAGSPQIETAEQLLELQWRRGDSPWKEEAALVLTRRYLDTQRYEQAETLAARLSRRGREQRIQLRARRDLLEALYWQEKDERVLSLLEEMEAERAPWDDELDLFRAVSSHRLQQPGWRQLFIDLFFQKRTSLLHARAYAYLQRTGGLAGFEEGVLLFFQGKDMLYRGQNAQAIEKLEQSLETLDPGRLDMEIVIRELGAAYLAEARYGEGAEKLLNISADLSPPDRLAAVEMAGRLYRRGGDSDKAKQLLLDVVRESGQADRRDRAIWFLLDMAARSSSAQLSESIEQFAPGWREPRYFSDLLEPQISVLVARRDWTGLLALYSSLKGYGPPDTMARLAYLAGRILSLGLVDAPADSLSPQALYLEARSSGASTYYRFLAETALVDLGFPALWTPGQELGGASISSAGDLQLEELPSEVIFGYFDYGMDERGVELLRSQWRSLSPQLLLDAATLLSDRGEYLHSMRLMNLYVQEKAEGVGRADLEILYPRAYGEWIDEVARSENLPAPVFFALVREESYFDPGIVSRSGAIGLTQLMSETAADSARWLHMEEYDLLNPVQNLRLGGRHFSRLYSRLEDIPKALMAYNAGLSRLRGWERSFPGMPSDLLAEAAPYPETRNYIRKILVSAVYYGALYYDRSLEQTVLSFFPGLWD
jgi:soluble lytic murein transglycosylase-like protein